MNKNAGFMLIELLVVVLIIGILAAVALPKYQVAVGKVRTMRLLPLMRAIDNAQQAYYMANGTYAMHFDDLDIQMPAGGSLSDASSDSDEILYGDFKCHISGLERECHIFIL